MPGLVSISTVLLVWVLGPSEPLGESATILSVGEKSEDSEVGYSDALSDEAAWQG